MIGSVTPIPSMSRSISSGSSKGPFRMMPDRVGKVPDRSARMAASSTSVRSAGMMTSAPSNRRGSTLTIDMPADDDPEHLSGEQVLVALEEGSADGADDFAHGGCDEEPIFRQCPHRDRPVGGGAAGTLGGIDDGLDSGDDLDQALGISTVGDDREQARPAVGELGERQRR